MLGLSLGTVLGFNHSNITSTACASIKVGQDSKQSSKQQYHSCLPSGLPLATRKLNYSGSCWISSIFCCVLDGLLCTFPLTRTKEAKLCWNTGTNQTLPCQAWRTKCKTQQFRINTSQFAVLQQRQNMMILQDKTEQLSHKYTRTYITPMYNKVL